VEARQEVAVREHRSTPQAQCPVRLGDACSLCFPGATGPQDCGLVQLVMGDDDLRGELARMRAERSGRMPVR
jgi:hypothetical protein